MWEHRLSPDTPSKGDKGDVESLKVNPQQVSRQSGTGTAINRIQISSFEMHIKQRGAKTGKENVRFNQTLAGISLNKKHN